VPVALSAAEIDRGRGERFAVRTTRPGDVIAQGWSGSVVRDADGPIGIVIEVSPDQTEAFAVRVDVVRRLMAAAPAKAAPAEARALPAIGLLAGTAADPATPLDRILGAGALVTPTRRTVMLVAAFPVARPVHRVALSTEGDGNRIEGLGLATEAGAEGWVDAAFCRAAPRSEGVASENLACPMLQRTVSRVRILVKTATNAPITLAGLVLD
jgi:hypothetical protein